MKHVPAILALCLMLASMTACRGEAPESSPETPTDGAMAIDVAASEEIPDAVSLRTDGPVPPESVEPGHLAGRFGFSNDVLDLKAADSDEAKVFDLKADGHYVFTGGVIVSREKGKWVLEENGTRLRLTPDNILPESGELLFAVTSRDKLLLLNPDGSPTNWSAGFVRIER
ncbi:hypothetical protein [Pseudoxanthomonas putridarboris]|uniref:NlpE N-terminal domain-containing protein n=1 Tax=Pseudoxanthomonas putridarboris TaxID=752605 RepID=A0ABU9IYL0_9GAMM